MKPDDVREYFISPYKFAKATKMSENTLRNWTKQGYVPFAAQKKLELLTNGELIAEWDEKELEKKRS